MLSPFPSQNFPSFAWGNLLWGKLKKKEKRTYRMRPLHVRQRIDLMHAHTKRLLAHQPEQLRRVRFQLGARVDIIVQARSRDLDVLLGEFPIFFTSM